MHGFARFGFHSLVIFRVWGSGGRRTNTVSWHDVTHTAKRQSGNNAKGKSRAHKREDSKRGNKVSPHNVTHRANKQRGKHAKRQQTGTQAGGGARGARARFHGAMSHTTQRSKTPNKQRAKDGHANGRRTRRRTRRKRWRRSKRRRAMERGDGEGEEEEEAATRDQNNARHFGCL